MSSRILSVRAQLILLAAVSCTLFALALAVAVWQLQAGGARLSGGRFASGYGGGGRSAGMAEFFAKNRS